MHPCYLFRWLWSIQGAIPWMAFPETPKVAQQCLVLLSNRWVFLQHPGEGFLASSTEKYLSNFTIHWAPAAPFLQGLELTIGPQRPGVGKGCSSLDSLSAAGTLIPTLSKSQPYIKCVNFHGKFINVIHISDRNLAHTSFMRKRESCPSQKPQTHTVLLSVLLNCQRPDRYKVV